MSKLFFYDIETTGTDFKEHSIHQIAAIIEINGKPVQEINLKCRPDPAKKIETSALEASRVTLEKISSYPLATHSWANLCTYLNNYVDKFNKNDKFHLVGFNNAGFDNLFLLEFWKDKYFGSYFWPDSIDTMVLASDFLKQERHKLLNFQLRTVAEYLGIDVDETKLHDASYDVELTRSIYYAIDYH